MAMDADAFELDANWLRRFRNGLRAWYERHARDLPWRRTHDPYRIWISEIMLQQTTVVAVIPYYQRWMEQFPTIQDLAQADEQAVLRLWEGLGYYSRARNIHRAARQLVTERAGEFPSAVADLQSLPGIGRYTAGAISSFAFDKAAPIVEANTLRLYCRLLGYDGDPRAKPGQELLWRFAEHLLPSQQPGLINQALMELGSKVCTPANPNCEECPIQFCCQARLTNRQSEIPRAAIRPEITPVTELSGIIRRAGTFLLYHRPPGERWAGLWDFPRFPFEPVEKPSPTQAVWLEQRLFETLGIQVTVKELFTEIKHSVTRYRITLRAYVAEHETGDISTDRGEFRWVAPTEFLKFPLSVTGRKLAKLLTEKPRYTLFPDP